MVILRESPWYLEIEAEAIQKGLQQGLQQGEQQGIQRGQAELVLRQLARRFDAVPPALAERVRRVPSQQMPDLLDIALAAGSLEEVAAAVETFGAGAAAAGNGAATA